MSVSKSLSKWSLGGFLIAGLQIAILTGLVGCGSKNNYRIEIAGSDPIAGIWVREEDAYRDWVVEIYEDSPGEYAAKSLWVPAYARESNSFKIGERKMRAITRRENGSYRIETLSRFDDGDHSYSVSEASLPTPDRLLLIDENGTGQLGDRQVWRRVEPDQIEMAYAAYGRGVIAAEREKFSEASDAYGHAVERLLEEKSPQAHSELANDLAWILATSPREALRKPQMASKLVPALGDWFRHNDTAAAVYAANGDFKSAIETQEKALSQIDSDDAPAALLRENGLNANNFMLQIGARVLLADERAEMAKRLDLYKSEIAIGE